MIAINRGQHACLIPSIKGHMLRIHPANLRVAIDIIAIIAGLTRLNVPTLFVRNLLKSPQLDLDIDVASGSLGIRACLVGRIHDCHCKFLFDTGHGDI